MINIKLADKIKETRIALEKNKDIEELKKSLQKIETMMQEFNEETLSKLFALGEKATRLECLQEKFEQQNKIIFELQNKTLRQQEQIKTLADSLQKIVRQIDLIENNYSILETIGGVKNE